MQEYNVHQHAIVHYLCKHFIFSFKNVLKTKATIVFLWKRFQKKIIQRTEVFTVSLNIKIDKTLLITINQS